MAGRHVALSVGAALVLGLGVYLWLAVRAAPAAPDVAASVPAPHAKAPTPASEVPAASASAPAQPQPSAPEATPPDSPASLLGSGAFGMSTAELDNTMSEANHAYDRGDYEEARSIAGRVLLHQPDNARMLRILVSSSCIEGDAPAAQASYAQLPAGDQQQMRDRCSRYGITLPPGKP